MGKRAAPDGLRNGIIRRGATYSYVVRVSDPSTGKNKPRWVGGFATASEAKSARDLARVSASRGAYLDRSSLTVGDYLNEWIAGHVEVKPKTRLEYGKIIRLYLNPRIGAIRLQGLRPTEVSRLYQDLLESGGRGGGALSPRSVEYTHAVLHRATRGCDERASANRVKPRHSRQAAVESGEACFARPTQVGTDRL